MCGTAASILLARKGADKAAINTAAIKRPALITEVAEAFGSQCMVLSIQAKRSRLWPGKWEAYYDNGRAHSGYDVIEWAKRGVALGAGEHSTRMWTCDFTHDYITINGDYRT